MQIRKATFNDINELRERYYETITTINSKDYNEKQIKAWASTAGRTDKLLKRIDEQYFFVAENAGGKITAFSSLDKTGYMDLLYVHKTFKKQALQSNYYKKVLKLLLNQVSPNWKPAQASQ
jgi:putative acetyltransferase